MVRGNKQGVKLRNSQRQECIQKVLTAVVTNVYGVFTWCLIYFYKIFRISSHFEMGPSFSVSFSYSQSHSLPYQW